MDNFFRLFSGSVPKCYCPPGSRASLGHGGLPPRGKTTAAESSDTWDCHYRSSHRRAFAFPAGVDCPPASINHCDGRIERYSTVTKHPSGGNTRKAQCISVAVRQFLSKFLPHSLWILWQIQQCFSDRMN